MTNEEWLKRDKIVLANVLPRASDLVFMRGQGSWLYDMEYNKYLDFTSGIAVNSTGHCHPQVVEAIQLQANTLIHTSVVGHHRKNIQLAEKLAELTPLFDEPQVFFSNSGAEAVDGAIKLARHVKKKPGVIAFRGGFHGRTYGATSLTTAKQKYRDGYLPLMGGVNFLDYGSFELKPVYPGWIGMMIVEPILGEGGYIVPPDGWLQFLREYCDRHDILLVFDEVQTGVGRTGNMWAAETFGVTPDVILFAKGIASGLPLGGIIGPRSIMDQWPVGTHGSTFGGNPVACAAALATLEIVEPLFTRVREKGEETVQALKIGWPSLSIRGHGYMIGIEMSSGLLAERVQKLCLERGLLVLRCGPEDNVIRLMPPLTMEDEEWATGLDILEKSLRDGILMYAM